MDSTKQTVQRVLSHANINFHRKDYSPDLGRVILKLAVGHSFDTTEDTT
jgi:hypothetical protein